MGPSEDEEDRQRDIDDVIREEKARRRPIDMDAIREAIRLRRDYWKLLGSGGEAMFRDYLTELG